jgi:hypothetical protein
LKNDDFFVQQGVLKTIPIFGLVNKGVLFSANGNNPNTPYKAFIMPHAPGQISLDPFSDSANFSIAYRLRPDEAIILIGRTPPS